MGDITAANAVFMLSIPGLFPIPQQLQGFSADDVFSTESVESAETVMGVDGTLSGGFVFVAVQQNIMLMADSPSNLLFDNWWAAQQVAKSLFQANGLVSLPAIGKKWIMTKGFLRPFKPIPDAKKVLQARTFGVQWERVSPAPI